MPQI